MTKKEWEKQKPNKEIPISLWFEYYRENGGILSDIHEFEKIFVELMMSPVLIGGKIINLKYSTAIKKLYEYYENKFSE